MDCTRLVPHTSSMGQLTLVNQECNLFEFTHCVLPSLLLHLIQGFFELSEELKLGREHVLGPAGDLEGA